MEFPHPTGRAGEKSSHLQPPTKGTSDMARPRKSNQTMPAGVLGHHRERGHEPAPVESKAQAQTREEPAAYRHLKEMHLQHSLQKITSNTDRQPGSNAVSQSQAQCSSRISFKDGR